MKLAPIVERLNGRGFATTGGVMEWSALRTAPGRLPAAYVVPLAEAAGDNRNDQIVDQRVAVEFAVMIVLNAVPRSGGVDELLDELVGKVHGALLGWRYPGAGTPTLYAGGGLTSADASTLVWSVRFRTAHHLRSL